MEHKIVTFDQIEKISNKLKSEGKKIVTTNGAFDLMHSDHIRSLREARSFGDVLIVGLNSDDSVRKYKSDMRPIYAQAERAFMLAALEPVNYVVIFNESEPSNFLEKVKPHIHVKGHDYSDGSKTIFERDVVEKNGGKIMFTSKNKGQSTTEIAEKVKRVYHD